MRGETAGFEVSSRGGFVAFKARLSAVLGQNGERFGPKRNSKAMVSACKTYAFEVGKHRFWSSKP